MRYDEIIMVKIIIFKMIYGVSWFGDWVFYDMNTKLRIRFSTVEVWRMALVVEIIGYSRILCLVT